ncbi:MAG: hypothetical protein Q9167_003734 [Letrouitia subvulpina]
MGPPQSLSSNKHSGGFTSSLKSSARRITSSISPSKHDDLYALTDRALPGFSTDRSSTSSRSSSHTVYNSRATSASSASLPYLSDSSGFTQSTARPFFSTSTTSPAQKLQTFEGGSPVITRPFTASSATPYASHHYSSASVPMTGTSYTSDSRPGTSKPSTAQSNVSFGQGGNSAAHPPPSLPPPVGGGLQNPHTVYQHIQDMCAKRVSTLDYLRKA